ncbi:MAG TPA: hypothetical protein VGO00_12445, partial [Kofleriaceae bacterium]|nr:hypothetical protein [Kofleriaceae bacterium]
MTKPPGYHQAAPVPGAYVDATLYPLGLGHGGGTLANIGIGFMLDKVLGLQSQITNPDNTQVKQPTSEQRYALNLSYRIPFSSGGMAAFVVGYGSQHFSITHGTATVDIPDVEYTGVAPQALLRYPIGAKMYLDLDAGAMLLTNAGQIQQNDQYGQATVLGITAEAGIDYMITKSLFARVTGRFETVGLSFKGSGMMSTTRDGDPTT